MDRWRGTSSMSIGDCISFAFWVQLRPCHDWANKVTWPGSPRVDKSWWHAVLCCSWWWWQSKKSIGTYREDCRYLENDCRWCDVEQSVELSRGTLIALGGARKAGKHASTARLTALVLGHVNRCFTSVCQMKLSCMIGSIDKNHGI